MTATTVGFVGLGNIGKPMALRLAEAGGDLVVYDVAAAPLEELKAAGARVATDVADLARQAQVICVMVRDDEQVRDVVAQISLHATPETTVAIHSTVAPQTPAQLEEEHRLQFVDAPVSGGAMGASAGTLAILVGGTDTAFAAVRPTLDAMGSLVVHAGPIGAGTKLKLARNLLHFTAFTAVTEAQQLAEAAGLDLRTLGEVVRHTDQITGGPGAIMHRDTTAPLDPSDGWFAIFDHVRALGEKDLTYALALAADLDLDLPLATLAKDRLGPGLGLPPTHQG